MGFIGFWSGVHLLFREHRKMEWEDPLIARWKDILLYLDTYHLILHTGIAIEKVGRGGKCVQVVYINPWHKTFFWYRALPWPRKLLPLTCVTRCSRNFAASRISHLTPFSSSLWWKDWFRTATQWIHFVSNFWNPRIGRGGQCKSIKTTENQCKSMKTNENQWKSMKINENQWKSMKTN